MVVRVLDHVRTASSYEDGAVIFRLLVDAMRANRNTTISFQGITAVPSAFINAAIVRLLEEFPYDTVRAQLRVSDSTRQINELIKSRLEFVANSIA